VPRREGGCSDGEQRWRLDALVDEVVRGGALGLVVGVPGASARAANDGRIFIGQGKGGRGRAKSHGANELARERGAFAGFGEVGDLCSWRSWGLCDGCFVLSSVEWHRWRLDSGVNGWGRGNRLQPLTIDEREGRASLPIRKEGMIRVCGRTATDRKSDQLP